ncbi:MAG: PAS domain S-box protein [Candidatus Cloacimonetes bacterium]|nr:PAS domain S-box protein [Candidatus Cloacimonadota bacterium]
MLKKSEEKLREHSENLEKMVAERTKQLAKSEESYKQLYKLNEGIVENSPAGIIKLDEELKIRYENPEMKKIMGIPSGEESRSMGMDIREIPSVKATGKSSIFNELLELKEIAIETPFTSLYGKKTYVTLKGVPIFENDKFAGAVLLINDITERKYAEVALQKEKEYYHSFVRSLTDWVWEIDMNGVHTYSNPAVESILGYKVDEVVGHHITELWLDNAKTPKILKLLKNTLDSGTGWKNFLGKFKHKNGSIIIMESTAIPIFNSENKLIGYRGIDHDITERKHTEKIQSVLFQISQAATTSSNLDELLKIIHQQLGELIDTSNFYVALYDKKNDLYSFPYFVDEYDKDFTPQSLHRSLTDYVRRTGKPLMADEKVHQQLIQKGEVDIVGPSSPIWLGVPLNTTQGTIGVVAVQNYQKGSHYSSKDLSVLTYISDTIALAIGRKCSEEEIHRNEEKFRDLFENANDVIWTSDIKGRYLTVNHLFGTLLGYSTKELINKQSLYLISQEDRKKSIDNYQKVVSGESVEYEAASFTKTGERKIFWLKLRPLKENGKVIGVHGIGRDITELKNAEEELREAEKAEREVLKELSLKLAHEIKNPLSSIYSSGQLASTTTEPGKIQRHMNVIIRNVKTCQKVIDDLYNFVQQPELELAKTDISKLLNNIKSYAETKAEVDIKVKVELNVEKGIPKINADEFRLSQAFHNIVSNAFDAMNEGGVLSINGKYLINKDEVLIEFIDTGCGIAQENLDRIFRPFYSSKAKGFGMGLSLVKDIINAHKGEISVESKEGKGTKFNVKLKIEG